MADLITLIIHDVAEFVSEEYTNALRYKLQEQMDGMESITPIRQTLSDFTRSLATNICGTGESLAQRSVKWAVQFIQHNYQADLNLELIAGKLYLSPCYFSRIFKKYTGQGFSNYLTGFRMRKAKSLLATGKYTVAEVARYIGIQDASYFCSVFKKYHLVTPRQIVGEYIRQEI
jgi:two-component system response regulator YesN